MKDILEFLDTFCEVDLWTTKKDPDTIHISVKKEVDGKLCYVYKQFTREFLKVADSKSIITFLDSNFDYIIDD